MLDRLKEYAISAVLIPVASVIYVIAMIAVVFMDMEFERGEK